MGQKYYLNSNDHFLSIIYFFFVDECTICNHQNFPSEIVPCGLAETSARYFNFFDSSPSQTDHPICEISRGPNVERSLLCVSYLGENSALMLGTIQT
jgi:hypothetical protein